MILAVRTQSRLGLCTEGTGGIPLHQLSTQGHRLFQGRVGPARFERRPTIRKHREIMVGRRGEAPLVPPYSFRSPNKAMALLSTQVRVGDRLLVGWTPRPSGSSGQARTDGASILRCTDANPCWSPTSSPITRPWTGRGRGRETKARFARTSHRVLAAACSRPASHHLRKRPRRVGPLRLCPPRPPSRSSSWAV